MTDSSLRGWDRAGADDADSQSENPFPVVIFKFRGDFQVKALIQIEMRARQV